MRLSLWISLAASAFGGSPPNILLLMTDQQRFDSVGRTPTITPNIDWLASTGLTFTSFYSSTPTCTPARSALLTGLSPWRHGMLGYGTIPGPQGWPLEMPRYLAENGYSTTIYGKNHFFTQQGENASEVPTHGYQNLQLYDGVGEVDDYDVYFKNVTQGKNPLATCNLSWNTWRGCETGYVYNESLHPTAWVGQKAVDFLRLHNQKQDQPFFLKVSFHRPHSPYDPPLRLYNSINMTQIPQLITGGNWDFMYTSNPSPCGPADNNAWCGTMPAATTPVTRRSYYANILFVDEWIGKILNETNLNNTWVLFFSDHGDAQGDHGLFRKGFPYEFSAHVPGLLRWPNNYVAEIPRGSSTNLLAEVRDIFPTVAAAAGVWPLKNTNVTVDGVPLQCLIGGLATPEACKGFAASFLKKSMSTANASSALPQNSLKFVWRTSIDLEHNIVFNETIHWNALVGDSLTADIGQVASHRMKFIFHAFFAREQLFDVTIDPEEMNDLSNNEAFKNELEAWRKVMVDQFQCEGRGNQWVLNGVLQQRVAGQLCSPNFPDSSLCKTEIL